MMRWRVYSILLLVLTINFNCAPDVDSAKYAAEVRETAEIRMAAEQGDASAQIKLGDRYAKGVGATVDLEQSFFWFRQAAEQGNALAQFVLGRCYAYGHGVPKDLGQAIVWFRQAAEQGNAEAQSRLGVIYVDCESLYSDCGGVPKDVAEAAKWFRRAANQGDALAMAYLGHLYEEGEGIPRDLIAAYQWYDLAGKHGWDLGDRRDAVAKKMTSEELAEAQARLSSNGPQRILDPK